MLSTRRLNSDTLVADRVGVVVGLEAEPEASDRDDEDKDGEGASKLVERGNEYAWGEGDLADATCT